MMSSSEITSLRLLKKTTPTGERPGRYCIVHYSRCSDHCLKPLSQKAFMSIKAACDIRMQSQNQMHRLSDICSNLPVDYDSEHHGFHQFCYKSFTNTAHVKAALHKSPKSLSAAQKSPTKCRKRPSAAATETLFPQNSCLFCDKGPTSKRGKFISLSRCETFDGAKKNKMLLLTRVTFDC